MLKLSEVLANLNSKEFPRLVDGQQNLWTWGFDAQQFWLWLSPTSEVEGIQTPDETILLHAEWMIWQEPVGGWQLIEWDVDFPELSITVQAAKLGDWKARAFPAT